VNVLWPAPIRGAYHQGDATGGDWVGSVIPGMQDASGLLYKRNRYYNPQTGQFTQPDPIGLAGGLNTYGFAQGDPVSYADPYGLCPNIGRDFKCPGGFSPDEYDRIATTISSSLTPEGAAPLLQMLEAGLIKNEPMKGKERRTQVQWHTREDVASYIRIGPDFWKQGEAAAAFMIAHEYGHVMQRQLKRLIYDSPDTQMSNNLWNNMTGGPLRHTDVGYLFFGGTQDDADRYACSVTTQPSVYTASQC
jgi:RHS repeat-associated protein